jgi:hypothetical protein
MKKKVKKYAEAGSVGGYGRFTEDRPKSVEDMKSGLFAGAPSDEPEVRSYSVTGPDTDTKPRAKPRAAAPKTKVGTGASGFRLNPREKDLQSASSVMKSGQAGTSDSGKNAALDKLMSDREATASREARRRSAMVDKANAGVPERRSNVDVAKERLGMKKGGSVGNASSRADGIAQRGKTRGKM